MARRNSDLDIKTRSGRRDQLSVADTDGFTPFASLRQEMDELFHDFAERVGHFGQGSNIPALDVDETDDAYQIRAELPGIAQEDIDITAQGHQLTICGEKSASAYAEGADHRVSECSYGQYERSVRLPEAFKADAIEAEYENGVLQMRVPKLEPSSRQNHKVAIKPAKATGKVVPAVKAKA